MINIIEGGKPNVKLIGAMPRESFVDVAGSFTRSEKTMEEIITAPYNEKLVEKIVGMNHLATTEFDYFVFAVEGLSRVTETQLVRKRLASYMIKSGRIQKGKRSFDVIKPKSLNNFYPNVHLNANRITINDVPLEDKTVDVQVDLSFEDLMSIIQQWYEIGVKANKPEEDLRYVKPQATEWKGLIGMNGHALLDWFKIRCCKNAQWEIRTLANAMLAQCKKHSPALFKNAGPSCKVLGYCPENKFQNKECTGVLTHENVLELIKADTLKRNMLNK